MITGYVATYTYVHCICTTQGGLCAFAAVNIMVSASIELENVDKSKLAAGPVFSIIDLVRMWKFYGHIIYYLIIQLESY